jgi:hypothetical protein
MAIDSRDKRASAINSLPIIVMPSADATTDANDRQQMTWLYRGVVAVIIIIVIEPPGDRTYRVPYHPRWFLVDDELRSVRIPALSRQLLVESDERIIRVPPESRSMT